MLVRTAESIAGPIITFKTQKDKSKTQVEQSMHVMANEKRGHPINLNRNCNADSSRFSAMLQATSLCR